MSPALTGIIFAAMGVLIGVGLHSTRASSAARVISFAAGIFLFFVGAERLIGANWF